MIKVKEDGTVEVHGNKAELMSELCTLIRAFLDEGVMNKDELEYWVNLASKSEDELDEELKKVQSEAILQMMRDLGDLL